MRDKIQNLLNKSPWGRNTKVLGLPLVDTVVLALPVAACAALMVSFVARYGGYFPDKLSNENAPLFLSASLPSAGSEIGRETAPVVGTPYLRPSFGLGAFSAETDKLPDGSFITPVASMATPSSIASVATTRSLFIGSIQNPGSAESQAAITTPNAFDPSGPHELAMATMAVTVAPSSAGFGNFRPTARPELSAATLAALTTTIEELSIEETNERLLAGYATVLSPRPEYRPARLLSAERALAAAQAARVAPESAETPTPSPTLASLTTTQPRDNIFTGGSGQSCSRRLARAIPRRAGRAQTGSAFIGALPASSGGSRDRAIVREAMSGNVPSFMRNLVPVTFTGTLANGRETTITICVTPDYLAIGSDADYVRVPLGLGAAGQLADHFNMMLPTTRMVDAIYAQANVRLSPKPMQAGSQMSSTPYFLRHNATVEGQRRAAGGRLGVLVSGHKKDLVLTNRLASSPGRVAIYGWHRTNGRPIQPLSTVHGASYADYSHGVRLVSQTAYVDGRAASLQELLQTRQYAQLLNSGGVIGGSAIRIAGL